MTYHDIDRVLIAVESEMMTDANEEFSDDEKISGVVHLIVSLTMATIRKKLTEEFPEELL